MAIRVIDDSKLQSIAVAIQGKGGGGQMTVDEMPGRIDALPTGGTTVKKAVNFYTFKGLAYSYTAEKAAALTEMPEPPTIEGFTFQKWNGWTVEKIKTWLENHDSGELSVGGLYVTTDGHTRIKMHLREPQMASFPMPFCIQQMAGTVIIDWGDGSAPETITAAGIYSHLWQINEYPANVVIDIEYIPSGSTKLVLGRDLLNAGLFNEEKYYASCVTAFHFGSNIDIRNASVGRSCSKLTELNIPDGVTSIGNYAFQGCTNLALTVLPDGVTSIGGGAFQNCTNLALTVLPDGVTSISGDAFSGCTNLALTALPDGITSIGGGAFNGCANLALTVLPDGVTSIGQNVFNRCTNLALTVLPDGVTSIGGDAFYGCTNLALTVLPDGVTSIGDRAFQYCTNLALTALPDGVTSIVQNAFNGCTNLALTALPDGITSIGGGAFQYCTNLALTALPDGITRIGQNAFQNCKSLYIIDLTAFTNPQSIPTLANTNAFQGIPTQAQFWVANQGMYDAFTTATNWSTYANKFVNKGV